MDYKLVWMSPWGEREFKIVTLSELKSNVDQIRKDVPGVLIQVVNLKTAAVTLAA